MGNARKAEVTVHLDRPRTLKLNLNIMCEAEQILKKSILREDMGLLDFRAILWAGLKQQDPKLTIQKVGEMMDEVSFNELSSEVAEGLKLYFSPDEKEVPMGENIGTVTEKA